MRSKEEIRERLEKEQSSWIERRKELSLKDPVTKLPKIQDPKWTILVYMAKERERTLEWVLGDTSFLPDIYNYKKNKDFD